MDIQWYPGHMKKAFRQMQEDLSLIDIVIEVCDARIPRSSRNPDIESLAKNKGRIILLSKSDLADEKKTALWLSYFKEQGTYAIASDMRTNNFIKQLNSAIDETAKEKRERDRKRGIKNRPVRAMVCGIPNSGKSTFINSYVKKAAAKTGNKPGVTKGKQWIHLAAGVDLLDTPGILYPKFDDRVTGVNLALCGSVNDNILNIHELSAELVRRLLPEYESELREKYLLTATDVYDIIREIAENRKLLKSGGVPDEEAAARLLTDDFRKAGLGRISLETP